MSGELTTAPSMFLFRVRVQYDPTEGGTFTSTVRSARSGVQGLVVFTATQAILATVKAESPAHAVVALWELAKRQQTKTKKLCTTNEEFMEHLRESFMRDTEKKNEEDAK